MKPFRPVKPPLRFFFLEMNRTTLRTKMCGPRVLKRTLTVRILRLSSAVKTLNLGNEQNHVADQMCGPTVRTCGPVVRTFPRPLTVSPGKCILIYIKGILTYSTVKVRNPGPQVPRLWKTKKNKEKQRKTKNKHKKTKKTKEK